MKMEDDLTLFDKEKIEKKQIFEFDKHMELNENISGITMPFLDRLFHQLTRSSTSESNYTNDEEFIEINENEITNVINDNSEQSLDEKKDVTSLKNFFRSFMKELIDEIDVIRGRLDEETFLYRRSQKVKPSISFMENKQNIVDESWI